MRGAVVDVAFDGGALPALNEALTIPVDGGAPILAEVHAHLSDAAVRALALGRRAACGAAPPCARRAGRFACLSATRCSAAC